MTIVCIIMCVSDESRKEDLVRRHLWEKSNMERYTSGTRKEPKRRR
jgi:DnaJ homolog subfamily C member 25